MNNVISKSFTSGKNFSIGHFCIIEDDVVVGDNVKIGSYVYLKKGTVIGNNTYIDSYVRSSGKNTIGNDVTIRYGATIARNVIIEDGCFVSPNVMTIYSEPGGKISSSPTLLKSGSFIGTAAVLGAGVVIGERTIIGSMAYVSKDCDSDSVYVGIPAKRIR